MSKIFPVLLDHRLNFPPPELALTHPNGLLAVGGDLSVERLKCAYQHGIFPWFAQGDPILWWSPDPRAVLYPQNLHIGRTMKKFIRQTDFIVTINHAFADVIELCARYRPEGSWITDTLKFAYINLHQHALAHSVEVWQQGELVGGLYGIEQGQLFCGESMFSRKPNASKYALILFAQHFVSNGGKLIDSQIMNPHTKMLGAVAISRADFLTQLALLQKKKLVSQCWQKQQITL